MTGGEFPSPYGVIFILIQRRRILSLRLYLVCFRLLTELYSFLFDSSFDLRIRSFTFVSVSLRSYIHSYSFAAIIYPLYYSSFRLLTELYSFLFYYIFETIRINTSFWFPSPYGVIFILTLYQQVCKLLDYIHQFPSPYGVIFILTKNQ